MKEASGEANMTVITIVLIGLVAGVGAILIPSMLESTNKKACCTSAGGTWNNGSCSVNNYWNSTSKKCV